jgi:hypothetical protein
MEPVRLLDEILSDYPRVWEFYKHDTSDKSRTQKYANRYPVPMGTLSLIIDFHGWVHQTTVIISSEAQLPLPKPVKKTEVGPCPSVMSKVQWMGNNWHIIKQRKKSLSQTLGGEIVDWHTKIRVKVNDGDIYSYQSAVVCGRCAYKSVVRINDKFICVNVQCRNPMTGEWRTGDIQ